MDTNTILRDLFKEVFESEGPKIKRHHLIKLGYHDSCVGNYVHRWQAGECTFEQALMYTIFYLVREKRDTLDIMIKEKMQRVDR